MDPLAHLAIIWVGVFAAAVSAKKTRMTPVLYFLFIGSVLANTGLIVREEHFQLKHQRINCYGQPVASNVFAETKRIIDIAYVQHDILNTQAFFTLMITAFFLNILAPATITLWKPYYLRATTDPLYQKSTP
jgi:hypothetical protein